MKFKLVNNKVTDEREEALNNKVAAECYYIMIAGTLVCMVYGSLFNKGVISANYLLYPLLIVCIWSIYRSERLAVNAFGSSSMTVLGCLLVTGLSQNWEDMREGVLKNSWTIWRMKNR